MARVYGPGEWFGGDAAPHSIHMTAGRASSLLQLPPGVSAELESAYPDLRAALAASHAPPRDADRVRDPCARLAACLLALADAHGRATAWGLRIAPAPSAAQLAEQAELAIDHVRWLLQGWELEGVLGLRHDTLLVHDPQRLRRLALLPVRTVPAVAGMAVDRRAVGAR